MIRCRLPIYFGPVDRANTYPWFAPDFAISCVSRDVCSHIGEGEKPTCGSCWYFQPDLDRIPERIHKFHIEVSTILIIGCCILFFPKIITNLYQYETCPYHCRKPDMDQFDDNGL